MPRKKLLASALLSVAALAGTGVAVAGRLRAQATAQVQATFDAGTVAHARTATCTGADGTYRLTTAAYTGTASSSDPRLNGPVVIRAHSIVDTASGLGWIEGTLRIKGDAGGVHGRLDGAISGGQVAGTVVGRSAAPFGRLVASLGSGFDPSTGFASGGLGTGTVSPSAVVFTRGACARGSHGKSTWVAHLGFRGHSNVRAHGSFTLDVTRDSSGTITGATAVFYVNYRSNGSLTLSGLALRQGAGGAVVVDSGLGTVVDSDGSGNVTEVVTGVSGSVAQSILSNPHADVVELATSAGTLDARLRAFGHRRLPRHGH
ncbi:MAG TPA: hypothetical protein VE088_07200 [Gaiellaceae bacterium]|jgi:hypothetical protein|nr:hypothetical protein [Gaiellaceae bacterium]